jgi:XTP/dITP diphosphohydrolase
MTFLSPQSKEIHVQPGESLPALVNTMAQLRESCPWDAKQTHESLLEYLVEEAYEVVEAIESSDDVALREELGDLLLQVIFHSHIASETQSWNVDDVIAGINDKLIRRHPHVFADEVVDSPADVEVNWHVRKQREKGRDSVTDGIPATLPALMRAAKVHARSVNVPLPLLTPNSALIMENVSEPEQLGALLFDLVGLAQQRGWDAEGALRQAINSRIADIRSIEGQSSPTS